MHKNKNRDKNMICLQEQNIVVKQILQVLLIFHKDQQNKSIELELLVDIGI